MQLRDLLGDVDVVEMVGDPHVEVTAITHDSRSVVPGSCFCCIPGAVTDGHVHAAEAVAAGAVALLVERRLDLDVPQARVASVRRALGPAAARLHGHPSRALRCLGITGTNGKTTTTHLLAAVAEAAGERCGLIGTLGARVAGRDLPGGRTTPEATELQALLARMRDEGTGVVAMEVSSHALDQHRVDGTWFAAVGFTNLSHEHLDYHGSIGAYFEAKASLFDPARTAAGACNVDDPHGRRLASRAARAGLDVLAFAVDDPGADVRGEDLVLDATGSRFVLVDDRGGRRAAVRSHLLGRFNVENSLAAAAVALAGGLPFDAVVEGLQRPIVVAGRLEPVGNGRPFPVLVDYAHTPDALERVLATLRPLVPGGRVLLVFGCGGDRDREKRPLMGGVAARGADAVYLTSDNPRSEDPAAIAAEVLVGLEGAAGPVVVELDRRAAIAAALADARPGDVVLVAGKGHETGQTVGAETRPFDDRVVAREELERRS
ncbi:MAG: UDP-N-acetylmuramoyl-L-alanyl-D-glutamate--2,6-diaminopimelate ligase [Acidimicrobiia bacterium]|nr:UDP-N-acetylmuramoyl-L-alanyl-D-glutamate--2,6-diaminopimelate ligase [Acidimicrobiia bacterium]